MAYTYTLKQGIVIESNEPLDVEQIASMEEDLDNGERIGNVVEKHGAGVYSPPTTTAHLFGLNG